MNIKIIIILLINLIIYSSYKAEEDIPDENDRPDNRIINGFTPPRNANPYVALLFIHFAQRRSACTGTLIAPNWVVTAGHCAKDAVFIEVHLGVYNRNETTPQKIIVRPADIIVHPKFVTNETVTINDIALLRLNPIANLSISSIKPIPYVCELGINYAGRTGTACGWGITSDTASNITFVIQCVFLPIITNDECVQGWSSNEVRETNICTRTVDFRTTCHGDSGGPLTVKTGLLSRPKLAGIVSFGSDPCAGTQPDVFTRISSFSKWIQKITLIFCDLL